MTTRTSKFTVRGMTGRTASQRRYIVVAGRPVDVDAQEWDYRTESYVPARFVAFGPEIVRRSDSIDTARAAVRRHSRIIGGFVVVVDTVTGEEV